MKTSAEKFNALDQTVNAFGDMMIHLDATPSQIAHADTFIVADMKYYYDSFGADEPLEVRQLRLYCGLVAEAAYTDHFGLPRMMWKDQKEEDRGHDIMIGNILCDSKTTLCTVSYVRDDYVCNVAARQLVNKNDIYLLSRYNHSSSPHHLVLTGWCTKKQLTTRGTFHKKGEWVKRDNGGFKADNDMWSIEIRDQWPLDLLKFVTTNFTRSELFQWDSGPDRRTTPTSCMPLPFAP